MKYQGIFRADLFKDHNIVITGGGSGIGRMTALELASLGAHVCLIGRNEEKLKTVQKEIQDMKGKASYACADIREREQIKNAIGTFVKEVGVLHGLVNNAGGQFFTPLENISSNGFDAVVKTNLYGPFNCMQEVFHQSMNKNGGAIVTIITNIDMGMPMLAHSGAARAGAENLTKSAALEWGKYGIRVNAVSPGSIASSGLDKYPEEVQKMGIPALRDCVPLKRLGTEAEVAASIIDLLSPAANYVTGITLKMDGGAALVGWPWPLQAVGNQNQVGPFESFV
ncbi:MAG: SDR family oxidoreductase [Bacteriovoracaceae bacterium]